MDIWEPLVFPTTEKGKQKAKANIKNNHISILLLALFIPPMPVYTNFGIIKQTYLAIINYLLSQQEIFTSILIKQPPVHSYVPKQRVKCAEKKGADPYEEENPCLTITSPR